MRLSISMPEDQDDQARREPLAKPNLGPATRALDDFLVNRIGPTGLLPVGVARHRESRLDPGHGPLDLGRNPVSSAFQSPVDALCRRFRLRGRFLHPSDMGCRRVVPRRVRGPRGLGDTGSRACRPRPRAPPASVPEALPQALAQAGRRAPLPSVRPPVPGGRQVSPAPAVQRIPLPSIRPPAPRGPASWSAIPGSRPAAIAGA